MIELQSITGMRPGELCIMRGIDIETTGKTWKYRPSKHKTAHHKHERIVDLGPRAQAIITTFFKPDMQAFIFSPADGAEARRRLRQEQRKTPLPCGNVPKSVLIEPNASGWIYSGQTTRFGDKYPLVKGWGAHYTAKGTFKVICGSFIAGDASPKQLDKYLDDLSAPPS